MSLTSKQNILKNIKPIISVAKLTLKEQDSKKYWKEYSKEISQKLWLPIETDSLGSASRRLGSASRRLDLDTHYLNGFLNNTKQSSFVIKNKEKNL